MSPTPTSGGIFGAPSGLLSIIDFPIPIRFRASGRVSPGRRTAGSSKSWCCNSSTALGLAGIVLYTSGILLAITAALYHLARRLCSDFTVVVLLVFVASLSLGRLYTPRPWHFTILFFILELDILMHARRTGRTRELAWLPLIFGLWANLHIQFVDGLLVIALAGSEAVVARWWSAARTRLRIFPVAITFVACLLATLVNPYGWGIYKVAHDLAAQPGVLDHVNELQAIPFRILTDYCVLLLAIAAVVALARYRRLRLFETALLGMAFLLAFRSQRDVWIMAAVATAVIASSLTNLESPPDFEIEPRRRGFAPALLLIPVVACLLLLAGFRVMDVNNGRLGLQLALDLPVDAAKAIKSAGYTGPLFNDYGWGGYLMWSLREPVSIDGRAALHGDQRMDRFSSTWDGAPDWISDRELAAAGVVIGPVKAPLIQLLRLDPRFKLVYEDKVAAVFIPNRI